MTEKRIHYGLTFAILSVAALAYSLLQSLVVPAIPEFEKSLHTSTTGATWVLTGYLLSAAVATPILGRVGDMIGKVRVMIAVLFVMSLGVLISALASGLTMMIVGRVVQGAGGAVFPLAYGIIRDEFPLSRVGFGIGMMSSFLGVGIGVGMVLGGPIIKHLSYHWLFWIPLVMTLASLPMIWLFVPESPVRAAGAINWVGAALMSGWLICLLVAITEAPSWGWSSVSVVGLLVATAVLVPLWVRSESRSANPLIDMGMMRIRVIWSTNLCALMFGFGMFAMFVSVPQFVETPPQVGYGFGASVTQSGILLAPFALTMLLVAACTGRLAAAFGSKPLLVTGTLFGVTSYTLISVAHGKEVWIYLATALLGVGGALGFSAMAQLIVEAVPSSQTSVATGMNTNIRNVGGALGSGITTSIIVSALLPDGHPREHGFVVASVAAAAVLLVSTLVAVRVPGRRGAIRQVRLHPVADAEANAFAGTAYASQLITGEPPP